MLLIFFWFTRRNGEKPSRIGTLLMTRLPVAEFALEIKTDMIHKACHMSQCKKRSISFPLSSRTTLRNQFTAGSGQEACQMVPGLSN